VGARGLASVVGGKGVDFPARESESNPKGGRRKGLLEEFSLLLARGSTQGESGERKKRRYEAH